MNGAPWVWSHISDRWAPHPRRSTADSSRHEIRLPRNPGIEADSKIPEMIRCQSSNDPNPTDCSASGSPWAYQLRTIVSAALINSARFSRVHDTRFGCRKSEALRFSQPPTVGARWMRYTRRNRSPRTVTWLPAASQVIRFGYPATSDLPSVRDVMTGAVRPCAKAGPSRTCASSSISSSLPCAA